MKGLAGDGHGVGCGIGMVAGMVEGQAVAIDRSSQSLPRNTGAQIPLHCLGIGQE